MKKLSSESLLVSDLAHSFGINADIDDCERAVEALKERRFDPQAVLEYFSNPENLRGPNDPTEGRWYDLMDLAAELGIELVYDEAKKAAADLGERFNDPIAIREYFKDK